jgi:hypothetical protein
MSQNRQRKESVMSRLSGSIGELQVDGVAAGLDFVDQAGGVGGEEFGGNDGLAGGRLLASARKIGGGIAAP